MEETQVLHILSREPGKLEEVCAPKTATGRHAKGGNLPFQKGDTGKKLFPSKSSSWQGQLHTLSFGMDPFGSLPCFLDPGVVVPSTQLCQAGVTPQGCQGKVMPPRFWAASPPRLTAEAGWPVETEAMAPLLTTAAARMVSE